MNSINRLMAVIATVTLCALLSGCGRKPYLLSVRDGKGVEKAPTSSGTWAAKEPSRWLET
jgi:hypothetical protein